MAAFLVPRVRTVAARREAGRYIRYLTIARALERFITAPMNANRFFDSEGAQCSRCTKTWHGMHLDMYDRVGSHMCMSRRQGIRQVCHRHCDRLCVVHASDASSVSCAQLQLLHDLRHGIMSQSQISCPTLSNPKERAWLCCVPA